MIEHGFLRVAAAAPRLRVADCSFNVEHMLGILADAERRQVSVLVFPELGITGYTCGDLFHQPTLQKNALAALCRLANEMKFSGVALVGLPLAVDDRLFDCAAVIHQRRILGLVPKSFLPNYKEFYERRWFAPAAAARSREVTIDGLKVPFGTDRLFAAEEVPSLVIGVEICEDLWVPISPSSYQAMAGATVLINLSASNEVIGKAPYRQQLVMNQSGRCLAAYVYASCGVHESTTDVVFGGHCLIAENGVLLAESSRFQRDDVLVATDVDLERLRSDRMRMNSFGDALGGTGAGPDFERVLFRLGQDPGPRTLIRTVDSHPFVPRGQEQLRERCEEIFHTQVAGLAKRLEHISAPGVCIGVSGGLDSTLALLVACKTMDQLGVPRQRIRGYTMPGFGTTARTLANARALIQHLGARACEADIRLPCLEEMKLLGHKPFGIDLSGLSLDEFIAHLQKLAPADSQDLVFENVQARMRTSILMNAGFVVGTGDLSELALGWSTYNADHMSMYNPNSSIPKTLVRFLVRWAAQNEFDGEARRVLLDIVATVISPELLPARADGTCPQETEAHVGPYELIDFFLYHMLRYGAPPEKALFLAGQAAFDRRYTRGEIEHWLREFIRRFFANQFKRSCLPDGPKVGSISLSPRGDWRMPSDAQAGAWLEWAGNASEPRALATGHTTRR
jgi:NAD+ synthase (glutamine-hydrolysing)